MWTKKLSAKLFIVVLFVVLLFSKRTLEINWLAIGKESWGTSWNDERKCEKATQEKIFNTKQNKFCERNYEAMSLLSNAASQTTHFCKDVFRTRRWNCSSIELAPSFRNDLLRGTREQAYAYALSAAAITYEIARACSRGDLTKCGCNPNLAREERIMTNRFYNKNRSTWMRTKRSVDDIRQYITNANRIRSEFKIKGCDEDVKHGNKISKRFTVLKNPMKLKKTQNANPDQHVTDKTLEFTHSVFDVNRHNGDVGRKMMREMLREHCKCNGMSGSCQFKTCWKRLPNSFKDIAEKLKENYMRATEVSVMWDSRMKNENGGRRMEAKPIMGVHTRSKRTITKSLVYIEKSPDYCDPDESTGSLGTQGRTCKKNKYGDQGCGSMCCGRGFRTSQTWQTVRCNCTYEWCCKVKCQSCQKMLTTHTCR